MKLKMQNEPKKFICDFCDKSFERENSYMAHQCSKKIRWLDKSNRNNVLGFKIYKRFYQLTGLQKKDLEYIDFINSSYFSDFIKFARWLNDADVVNANGYIDYVIKNSIKLKDWMKSDTYESHIKQYIFNEESFKAVERSLEYIVEWCSENNYNLSLFFSIIPTGKFVDLVRSGKISPWLIFTSNKADEVMNRLEPKQHKLLENILNTRYWHVKLNKNKKDVADLKEILKGIEL